MGLLSEIEERDDKGSIAIDADSILFTSCYLHREQYDIELAYMTFMERIGKIRQEAYNQVSSVEDLVICFTSKTNFRYKIYPEYKANRKTDNVEANLLKERSSELKKLVYKRVKSLCKASSVYEADDIVIQYAYDGYMVSAMDKDVVNACPTKCYDYKKGVWNEPRTYQEIKDWYLIQSITGDSSDGIKGVNKYGKVKADKFMLEMSKGIRDYNDYVELFDTPADCLLMNQLVRMNQYDEDKKLKLITMKEIIDECIPF